MSERLEKAKKILVEVKELDDRTLSYLYKEVKLERRRRWLSRMGVVEVREGVGA
jgi:hypothetical protein